MASRAWSPAPTSPTPPDAASSPAATSPSTSATCGASRPATASTAPRSGSSPRSRSATSSSSAPATRSRSAHLPRRVRPGAARSGWAPTGSAPRASPPRRSSSTPTTPGSRGRARSRRATSSSSALGKPGTPEHELAERLYGELGAAGLEVLYDDRDAGPGEKFADAELLGCPLRVTVGRRTLEAGDLEVQIRRGRETASVPLEGAAAAVAGAVARRSRLTPHERRLLGPRPLGPAAARDPGRGAAATRGRSRTRSATLRLALHPGVPGARLPHRRRPRRAAAALLFAVIGVRRLPGRHRRAGHRPVQPAGRAARPDRRPPAGRVGHGRRAGTSSCCRAGRSRS